MSQVCRRGFGCSSCLWVADARCVPVFIFTLHVHFLLSDPSRRIKTVRNKLQVGLTFPYVFRFCLPVINVWHNILQQVSSAWTFVCSETMPLYSYFNTAGVVTAYDSCGKHWILDWTGLWSISRGHMELFYRINCLKICLPHLVDRISNDLYFKCYGIYCFQSAAWACMREWVVPPVSHMSPPVY